MSIVAKWSPISATAELFFGVATVNIFVSAPNGANATERIFLSTVSNGRVLHGSSLSSIPEQDNFCAQTFHKVM